MTSSGSWMGLEGFCFLDGSSYIKGSPYIDGSPFTTVRLVWNQTNVNYCFVAGLSAFVKDVRENK